MVCFITTPERAQNLITKTDPMLTDLEFAYNPVEQKARDLQEYL